MANGLPQAFQAEIARQSMGHAGGLIGAAAHALTASQLNDAQPEIQRELQHLQQSIDFLHENLRDLACKLSPVVTPMQENELTKAPEPTLLTDMGLQIHRLNGQTHSAALQIASLVQRLAI